jgi:hypothetical protein
MTVVKLNPTLPTLKRFLLDVKAMPDARPVRVAALGA